MRYGSESGARLPAETPKRSCTAQLKPFIFAASGLPGERGTPVVCLSRGPCGSEGAPEGLGVCQAPVDSRSSCCNIVVWY